MSARQFLLLEASLSDAEMVQTVLTEAGIDYELLRVDTRTEFIKALETEAFDLILSDYALPDLDGFSALEIVRSLCPDVPFIFVSTSVGEEWAIEALKSGATDYVLKHRLERLVPSVKRALWEAQAHRERQAALRDRQQLEASLRASEEDFHAMFNVSGVGKAQADVKTRRFLRVNATFCAITGYTESELLALTIDDINHPDDRDRDRERFISWLQGKSTSYQSEKRYLRKDGSIVWVLATGNIIYDSEGRPHRTAAVIQDITDRKRAEAILRDSEEQSRNILESISDGFFALDENWRFTYVNQAAATLLDRTPDDLLGKNVWEEYPGLAGSEFERIYWGAMRDRVAGSITSFYPDHDRWYEVHTYPAAQGITIYFRNATERIRAVAALRQSEERYRTLFESIDEGFCIVEILLDENGTPIDYRFLETNPVFEQQTGLKDPVGKTARQLVPNLEDEWVRIYGQVGLTGEPVRFENGSEAMNRWFDVYACRMGQPEARKVALVFKDISERKRIEQERERLLQYEQAAREAAETANRIKDEFLAVLSHELRSPLNPILGWTRLLQSGKLDAARQAEALATIERNARLQTQLIEDLLDISSIMRGKLTLKSASVSLTFVISSAVETVRLAAEAKNIGIRLDLDTTIAPISGDAARLQQVVWNLLSNAVKFTPNGGQVTVELRQCDQVAQIRVMDTGKGINSQFLPHVFDYFRQEDGSTTRQFGGLGLGLAIARQIVELHGGTIQAESLGDHQGATFTVQLPVMQSTLPIVSTISLGAERTEVPLSNVRVLVIDDDADTREFQAFLLEQSGAEVATVASGSEALQVLDQCLPDVVISDVGMAEMNGYMLMQQIRSRPPDRGGMIPAIALTAYARDFDQQVAREAGFQAHIAKPVEPEVLIRTIVTLIDRE